MDLSCFARYRLFDGPTAIEPLTSLNAELDGVRIFVKRDDVSGIGAGGNKLRKLEFLLGEAIAQGADTMLTVGGRQSNHARLTAAASARAGLKCELVLPAWCHARRGTIWATEYRAGWFVWRGGA